LILGSVLFNIGFNNPDDGTKSTFGKVTDDTTEGVARTPDGCAAIQRDLNKQENWSVRNFTKFNRWKCSSATEEE